MKNINDKLYIHVSNTNGEDVRPNECYKLVITSRNYTGIELAAEIIDKLNERMGSVQFSSSFSATTQRLVISTLVNNQTFKVLTESDIATKMDTLWLPMTGADDYTANDPQDINTDMLKLNSGLSSYNTFTNPFVTIYINLQPIRNMYLSSPNLCNYKILDLRGRRDIIKKIPVTANFNEMIIDNVSLEDDYLDCSKQTLTTLEFRLSDDNGHTVELNGTYVSFSIIFDVLDR